MAGVGGWLTGWIDWNKNGTFQAGERLVWTDASGNSLGNEAALNPGTHNLRITAPAGVTGPVAARFRWGEQGLSFSGPANIGEVEDYLLAASTVAMFAGDYNGDNKVDTADYVVWRKYMGTNTVLPNDTTPGSVGQEDFVVWKQNYGNLNGAGAGGGSGAALADAGSSSSSPATSGSGSGTSSTTPPTRVAVPLFSNEAMLAYARVNSMAAASIATAPVLTVVPQAPSVTPSVDSSPSVIESPSVVLSPSVPVAPANSISSLLAIFTADASTSVSIAPSASFTEAEALTTGAGQSYADLLLLDQALAELDDDTSDEDAPLCDRRTSEDENTDDLAVAAVFEDESNWWSL